MRSQVRQSGVGICHWCELLFSQRQLSSYQLRRSATAGPIRGLSLATSNGHHTRPRSTVSKRNKASRLKPASPTIACVRDASRSAAGPPPASGNSGKEDSRRPALELGDTLQVVKAVSESGSIPSEKEMIKALEPCKVFADQVAAISDSQPQKQTKDTTPTSSLLSLEESNTPPAPPPPRVAKPLEPSPLLERRIDAVSRALYDLMLYPPVFLTPAILSKYVDIQTLLQRPQTLPEIFALYATKPMPHPDTKPIKYSTPNPFKAQFAVPLPTANLALQSAIIQRDLPLALSIISSTVSTTAFLRNKLLRKALAPLTGLALAPLAAYAIASRLSELQNTMDPQTATNLAFGGIVTYVGATATIGLVALTTANDQMERVTWAQGTPLRDRWLKEEERAALDRVALAWGFSDRDRRGEEEGEEWEMLREWIGTRGMVLDKVELMEDME